MRRFFAVLSGLVVVLVLGAFVALVALQTVGKDPIAQALSSALGAPVEIGTLSVSILPTPALNAGAVHIGNGAGDAAPGLAVTNLRIVPSIWSLIPGRTPTITRADLNGFVVSIRRTPSGEWMAPGAEAPEKVAGQKADSRQTPSNGGGPGRARVTPVTTASAPASPSKTPTVAVDAFHIRDGAIRVVDEHLRTASGTPTITSITGINGLLRYVDGALSIPDFEAHLGHSVVRASADAGANGITLHLSSAAIHNEDLPALAALAGVEPLPGLTFVTPATVDITTHVAADYATLTATGKATIGRLKLERLTLGDVRVPFRLDHNVFTSDSIVFSAYGGQERGRVSFDLGAAPASYTLRTTLDQVDVNDALSATTTMKNVLSGRAHLSVDVKGSGMTQSAIAKSLTGTVQFAVQNGEVRNMSVLATIERVLGGGSSGGAVTKFDSLAGTATIANGQARTTDLTLKSGDLNLAGTGTLGLVDQSLNLVLTAQLSPARSAQIARAVPFASRLENASKEMQLPVKITGTASAPKVEGIAVTALSKQNVGGLVKQLLKR